MQQSTDSIWSASALNDRHCKPGPWVRSSLHTRSKPQLQLRGLAWSIFLSAILWTSFIVVGRELWIWCR
jgi:hypothetical protein